jgi:hypothetical protein
LRFLVPYLGRFTSCCEERKESEGGKEETPAENVQRSTSNAEARMPSGSSANPFKKSAFTGGRVAATTSPICESISPNKIAPSGFPREKAKPADALNPSCCKYTAVPASHGFGRTKHPDSWSARNRAIAEDCAEFSSFICKLIPPGHAGPTVLGPCEDEERGVC